MAGISSVSARILRPSVLWLAVALVSSAAFAQGHGQRNPMKGPGKPKGMNGQREQRAAQQQQQQQQKAAQNQQQRAAQQARQQQPRLNPNQLQQQRIRQEIMRQIDLKPEQQTRIREINVGHDDEIRAAGRRVRIARQALDQSLMSEQFDEADINRRAEEFAAARAEQIKMEVRL